MPGKRLTGTLPEKANYYPCAPLLLFLLLPRLTAERRAFAYPALAWALVASIVPYAARWVVGEHLYLLLVERRVATAAGVAVGLALAAAATAMAFWVRGAQQAGRPPGPQGDRAPSEPPTNHAVSVRRTGLAGPGRPADRAGFRRHAARRLPQRDCSQPPA